jgi:protein-tyrosine phosphatase
MKYGLVFGLLGLYLVGLAAVVGGWTWLLAWPGASLLLVAVAFVGAGPRLFGKRPDGTVAWWALLTLLPYLLLTWALWHLLRLTSREPCCHEIVAGVWVGRRVYATELPPDVSLIVDLTAEFAEPRAVRAGRSYVCLPTLDATAPEERAFGVLVRRVDEHHGNLYIHCASGHGRAATVAAALLLTRGLAADVRGAEALLRGVRPGVRLKKAQRQLLERFLAGSDRRADATGSPPRS